MVIRDLGLMEYRAAWKMQEEIHAHVVAGGEEVALMLEHPAVITLGRRPGQMPHVLAAAGLLAQRGVEVIETDRGGDVTLHAPGQLVVYPIVRLVDHRLSVGGFVHGLEDVVIGALAELGVEGVKDRSAPGVWVSVNGELSKICALGVRVKRGVTMHGVALNVSTDLSLFELIVPCGLSGRGVTTLSRLPGLAGIGMGEVKLVMGAALISYFS